MGRFLIFFSYIGTHYRGMQIQRRAGEVIDSIKTVQGVLEEYLRRLHPVNEVMIKTSSRTDSSVHALANTCHVDLTHRRHPREFNPQWITASLNRHLIRADEKLRILNTIRVPDTFSSRHEACERSYVFRLAVIKHPNIFSDPHVKSLPWTALDSEFSTRVYAPFDMELFLKAGEMLSGTHNFLSFTTRTFMKDHPHRIPVARLDIRVERGKSWMEHDGTETSHIIDRWDVNFTGLSFLYKQVRRMMGTMVGVAQGRMSVDKLQQLLDRPSVYNPGQIEAMHAVGLTLKRVDYQDWVYDFCPEVQGKVNQTDDTPSHHPTPLHETVAPSDSLALTQHQQQRPYISQFPRFSVPTTDTASDIQRSPLQSVTMATVELSSLNLDCAHESVTLEKFEPVQSVAMTTDDISNLDCPQESLTLEKTEPS